MNKRKYGQCNTYTNREFLFDENKVIAMGQKFSYKIVEEFMKDYNVNEFEARCSLAEQYLINEMQSNRG